jgi:N-acetylmuramoyl-L-alanine amidase
MTIVRARWFVMPVVLAGALLFLSRMLGAAEDRITIYFDDSTLSLKTVNMNSTVYLPLSDVVDHLHLPYTDAKILEEFTIGSNNAKVLLAKNTRLIVVKGSQEFLLYPVVHENQQWMVPVEFLSKGLTPITGIEFRYKPGVPRIFTGKVAPIELLMNAQALGPITRLTIGTSSPVTVDLKRDAPHRAVVTLGRKAIDPVKERLDYRDRFVRSIAFDDSDGGAKLVVETTDNVGDIRVSSLNDGRVHFIDFSKRGVTTEAEPAAVTAPTTALPAAPKPDAQSGVRVVVIDPGHGGMDFGAMGAGATEKDITLAMARALRTALRIRLGANVLLTRDSDVALSNEQRSAFANNSQADLFISLHVGYSLRSQDSGSSIYVIKGDFAEKSASAGAQGQLFLPWYMGYRRSLKASAQFAGIAQDELGKTTPEWKFPVRSGPVAVLASTTMPAVALEVGSLNGANPLILDAAFQTKIVSTIVSAVERYAAARRGGA